MVKENNPCTGDVCILLFTDYQFGEIQHLSKFDKPKKLAEQPAQYQLF